MADLARIAEIPAQLHSRFPKHKESTVLSSDGEQTLDGICARSKPCQPSALQDEGATLECEAQRTVGNRSQI